MSSMTGTIRMQAAGTPQPAIAPTPPTPPTPPDLPVPRGPGRPDKVITLPGGQQIIIGSDGDVTTTTGEPIRIDARDAVPTGAVQIVSFLCVALVLCVVGFPIARAFARWMDRRSAAPRIPPEVMARLANIENAVETVAVEVERISEGQRFTSKLLAERAERVADRIGERVG